MTMRPGRDADRHAIAVGKRKLANGAGIRITTTSPAETALAKPEIVIRA
jgi:hypothetical protein